MISVDISHETRNSYRSSDGLNPCWVWCVQQFGHPNGERWIWDTRYKFTFKYEEDATLFALRWV